LLEKTKCEKIQKIFFAQKSVLIWRCDWQT